MKRRVQTVFGRKRFVTLLSVVALSLVMANSVMLIIYFAIDDPRRFDFVRMVDLDQEANLPTLFSSLLLICAAALLYLIAKSKHLGYRRHWYLLSIFFVFLSFDESAKIHENIGDLTGRFVEAQGVIYFPWVLTYGILVLAGALYFLPFLLKLPRKLRNGMFVSALLFLSGAIGLEMLGAKEASMNGLDTPLYCILYTIEESLEMAGVIYLINALWKHLEGLCVLLES